MIRSTDVVLRTAQIGAGLPPTCAWVKLQAATKSALGVTHVRPKLLHLVRPGADGYLSDDELVRQGEALQMVMMDAVQSATTNDGSSTSDVENPLLVPPILAMQRDL
eukprot:SAG22_NODE_637_length_8315_cov_16.174416_2_plen_107_part_00